MFEFLSNIEHDQLTFLPARSTISFVNSALKNDDFISIRNYSFLIFE